jgi:hypothetical protein
MYPDTRCLMWWMTGVVMNRHEKVRAATCGIVLAIVTLACHSAVPSDIAVPADAATAKAVIDQVTPGRTVRLDALFDIVTREASSKHLLSREYFQVLASCDRSDVLVHILALRLR